MNISKLSFLLSLTIILSIMACTSNPPEAPESGVSEDLAQIRKAQLSEVVYHLSFQIPEALNDPIEGNMQVDFLLSEKGNSLVLDFRTEASEVKSVKKGEKAIPFEFVNDHIIVPSQFLSKGKNSIQIEFTAGELSLNRSEEYLYTLFVPDRASTAFPCFDQPDIKARYRLELEVPEQWMAIANGAVEALKIEDNKKHFWFSETAPISTYLFAFAAGRFQQMTQIRDGREMNMFFRETDTIKVANNADEVFNLHAAALSWLEAYTGIDYPFEKFDFVLIPTFQYGGMEHVGNIFYKERSLFLDPSATENQKLSRASLIAHETAHMWFGDLVTMDWFSDVWLKEVFANFMAAKIVNPSFPEVNHDLRFLMAHQPSAYGEDRSQGAHPIQQKLENLKDAGALYGRIIYQKAPVVMQQLEQLVGEEDFRGGLQEYLNTFSFGNASWDDLISILDQKTKEDLRSWSQVWVKEAGMPLLETRLETALSRITHLSIDQKKQSAQGNYWTQYSEVALLYEDSVARFPIQIEGDQTAVPAVVGYPSPKAVLANGSKMSYGCFQLSEADQNYLLDHISRIKDPVLRGAAWMSLYEACLNKKLTPDQLLQKIMQALPMEKETLNRQNLLGYIRTLFWKLLNSDEQLSYAEALENLLWQQMEKASTTGSKSAFFKTYQAIAQTGNATDRLLQIWKGDYTIEGLPLSESDLTDLACQLALLNPEMGAEILDQQLAAIKNPDNQKRLQFIRPALAKEVATRDAFFENLKKAENRHYEPWVVDALAYLHHPLRSASAEKYILPSLELMEEIQSTGDIFFPRRWITATLSGHQSPAAAQIVKQFLAERPEYPYRLKNKILMGADMLYRAAGE